MTAPGTAGDVPEADRAEQEALLDAPDVTTAGAAQAPSTEVPEGDALDQQLVARPLRGGRPVGSIGDREADEADVLEQEFDVPLEDDDRS